MSKTGPVVDGQNKERQTTGWRVNMTDQTIWQIHVGIWAAYCTKGKREAQVKSITLITKSTTRNDNGRERQEMGF